MLALGPIRLDLARRAVTVADHPVSLTPHEYELLKVMLAQPGRVLTRGRLLRAVWGREYAEEGHYLHVYVGRLRRKLAAADPTGESRSLFVAEPGVGCRPAATPDPRPGGAPRPGRSERAAGIRGPPAPDQHDLSSGLR